MAARANWKGYLRLSLVSCPIALFPATSESEKVRGPAAPTGGGAECTSPMLGAMPTPTDPGTVARITHRMSFFRA